MRNHSQGTLGSPGTERRTGKTDKSQTSQISIETKNFELETEPVQTHSHALKGLQHILFTLSTPLTDELYTGIWKDFSTLKLELAENGSQVFLQKCYSTPNNPSCQ